jgi:hypothetical protein
MSWLRAIFRLWVVISALWVTGTGLLGLWMIALVEPSPRPMECAAIADVNVCAAILRKAGKDELQAYLVSSAFPDTSNARRNIALLVFLPPAILFVVGFILISSLAWILRGLFS